MQYPPAPQHQQVYPTPPTPNATPTDGTSNTEDPDTKILSDLSVVQEKITLCRSMLIEIGTTSQIDSNESLLAIIGFLEACVPRVRELIDVGMTLLKEKTLTVCFQINDDLCKILDDVDHPEQVTSESMGSSSNAASPSSTSASAAAVGKTAEEEDGLATLDFDAFGLEDQKQAVRDDEAKAATTKVASSALEDLLAPPSSVTPMASPEKKKTAEGGGDDFDDFFGKRVGNNSFSIDE